MVNLRIGAGMLGRGRSRAGRSSAGSASPLWASVACTDPPAQHRLPQNVSLSESRRSAALAIPSATDLISHTGSLPPRLVPLSGV